MHPNSLRVPFLASVSISTMLVAAAAQSAAAKPQAAVNPAASAPAASAKSDDTHLAGLPGFLLTVPGGVVELGLEAEVFTAAACQVSFPSKPELAPTKSTAKVTDAMRRSASTLGRRKVEVPTFLLGKTPITNAQYEVYVAARRKAGAKVRVPFHWWRFGAKDDYDKRLAEIEKEFPKLKEGPLMYWERHGHELPYKLVDDKGRSIADLPVTYISWREANEFAGWLGARLPLEAEWTRAARGDTKITWPLAKPEDPSTDRFTEQLLKDLQIYNSRDWVAKPVGTVQAAKGPFGHLDMFGQIWQLLGDLGYRPINGAEAFATEWKTLQKDKTGQLLQAPPPWKDEKALAKGGSFLSAQEPIQLLIDSRAPVQTDDVLEGLGMRLAKSIKPGYDAIYSAMHGSFSKSAFAIDQDVDLSAQVGAERYEVDANGFPTRYDTISVAPVNFLSKEKNAEVGKLLEKSMEAPILLGVVMSTDKLLAPAAPAGAYSLLYRKGGLPKQLVEAIKQGHRELSATAKSKPDDKGEEADAKDKDKGSDKADKKDKKSNWRDVIARFGLTEKDLESKDAADGNLKFVRIDGIEVAADDDCFLLQGSEGKVVAAWKATNAKPAAANGFPSTISLEANDGSEVKDKTRAVAKLHFGVPINHGNTKRVADVHLHLVLDREAPTAEKPWRVPTPPAGK